MKKYCCLLLFVIQFTTNSTAQNSDSLWVRENYYKVEKMLPMRDGISLFTAFYIPKDTTVKHPILLNRTPYTCSPYGEDKFIGPFMWRITPDSAKGGTCVVYPKDGDHNLAIKWASDNGIAVNPDFTTYDPNALNFTSADDFLDAARKYQNKNSYTIERDEVINGKKNRSLC